MAVDYYQILQIPPSADIAEIKAAYRKLAHLYHPDKNPDNKSSRAYFDLIKEAYETLSNAGKKEKYLQERWLAKAYGHPLEQPIKTPEHILKQVLLASDQIRKMDIYRMNKDGVGTELNLLLSEENISLLNEFNEMPVNDAIVKELLYMVTVLPASVQTGLFKTLRLINSNYAEAIKNKEEELEGKIFWETWKPAFIILIVVLLCILIWGTSLK
ncbi:J domain-containing protein [Niabella aquatica]